MKELHLVIPLIPPSVNHYKLRHTWGKTTVSKQATAFKWAVAVFAQGTVVQAEFYEVEARVYFAKGGKGDGDNLWKCIGDGLKDAGVIRSDAAVKNWIMHLDRDWNNPRTEIWVREFARTLVPGK